MPDARAQLGSEIADGHPDHVGILKAHGDLYTRGERIAEGLSIDQRLVQLCPRDDVAWYNLGCSYALTGDSDRAFAALERAAQLGYCDTAWMGGDSDLSSLHADPRFAALIERMAVHESG